MRVFRLRESSFKEHCKKFFGRRVIHRSCGEQIRRALLASVNNSGIAISRDGSRSAPWAPSGAMAALSGCAHEHVYFGEHLKQIAEVADKICVIRAMTHGEADHDRGTH